MLVIWSGVLGKITGQYKHFTHYAEKALTLNIPGTKNRARITRALFKNYHTYY